MEVLRAIGGETKHPGTGSASSKETGEDCNLVTLGLLQRSPPNRRLLGLRKRGKLRRSRRFEMGPFPLCCNASVPGTIGRLGGSADCLFVLNFFLGGDVPISVSLICCELAGVCMALSRISPERKWRMKRKRKGGEGNLTFLLPFEQGGGRRRRRRKRPWADLAVGTRRRRRAHEKGEVKKVILPLACASS